MHKSSELSAKSDLPVSLDSLSQRIALREQDFRHFVASEILTLFKWSVGSTVAITMALVLIDAIMLWNHAIQPEQRLVSERVLLALIGASVVQVGAAGAAIVYGMFGRHKDKLSNDEADEASGRIGLD